ncbi:polymorphic toxin-type HINT domain-containing protein [Promicromonospora umidemergens]|uniref:Hint domain-containing protein n=1 Tax=Promicromonospora umidemergens TaxID=629679 RepID=A0ABP8XWQ2_9MICO|nr:polymorphic toxin-type HINT domain-containing protein [Promicromonospora umidemergens]
MLVLSGGQEYQEVARSIDNAASSMSRLDVDGTVSNAVDSLMDAKEDTISEIRKAHSRYVAAGDALAGYASSLERVQSETLAALDRARDAQDAADSARGSKDRWQDLADSAKDETEKQEYEQKAEQAGGDADQAAGVISSAKSAIETAVSDRDTAANSAIDQIEEITSNDDLNDGWWDNWGSKLVAAIADIADMISTIAGILAIIVAFIPVVGTALAGVLIVIAAVAAIVSAVANITLAATGERSWAEAGIAIAGAALSLIGLGGAAKAAMGLSKTIAKSGGFRQAMSKGWCKFGFGKCFVAGTLIHTPDGPRAIEEIRVGDKVWARDLETGRDELQLVVETFVRTSTELFHLTIDGERVSTTAEHPFMVQGRGWLDAAFLRVGDLLVTPEGTTVPVEATDTEQRTEADAEMVYNFHVETHHNYYVRVGAHVVLVHNSDHVKALDVGTYKDLKKRAKVGDGMEHDHIPSSAALQRAKEIELGRDLKPHEIREIHEQGNAIELPKEVHAKGDTYKGRNSQTRIEADATDLGVAAERDYATQSQNMINEGYSPEAVAKAFDELRELNKKRGI